MAIRDVKVWNLPLWERKPGTCPAVFDALLVQRAQRGVRNRAKAGVGLSNDEHIVYDLSQAVIAPLINLGRT